MSHSEKQSSVLLL